MLVGRRKPYPERKRLRTQKYPDTCGRGLKRIFLVLQKFQPIVKRPRTEHVQLDYWLEATFCGTELRLSLWNAFANSGANLLTAERKRRLHPTWMVFGPQYSWLSLFGTTIRLPWRNVKKKLQSYLNSNTSFYLWNHHVSMYHFCVNFLVRYVNQWLHLA